MSETISVKQGDIVLFHPWFSADLDKFVVLRVHPSTVDLGHLGVQYHEDYNRRKYLAKKSKLFRFDPELWDKIQKAVAEVHEKEHALYELRKQLKPLEKES